MNFLVGTMVKHPNPSWRHECAQNIGAVLGMQVPACEACLPLFPKGNGVRRINVQGAPERALWSGPRCNATSDSESTGTGDPKAHVLVSHAFVYASFGWFRFFFVPISAATLWFRALL